MNGFLATLVGLVAAVTSAFSQTSEIPKPITSQEWTQILVVAAKAGKNKDTLSTALEKASRTLASKHAASIGGGANYSRLTPAQRTQSNQVAIVCALLSWYAMDISTSPQDKKGANEWLRKRVAMAAVCAKLKETFGATVVDESWANLNSAAHVLGIPQAKFPQ